MSELANSGARPRPAPDLALQRLLQRPRAGGQRVDGLVELLVEPGADPADCPGREPPFLVVKRNARPHRSAIQNRFTMENAKGA